MIFKNKWLYLPALLLMFASPACNTPEQKLTKSEAIEFARELENTIGKGDAAFLDNAFAKKEFVKRMKLPDNKEADSYTSGILQKLRLGSQLTAALTDRDNFSFIKHYEKEGKHHVLFRIYIDKDGSLNYQDYELVKSADKCKVADVYIYMSGETMAETLSSLYNTLDKHAEELNKPLADDNLEGIHEFKNAKDLMMKGKFTEAKEVFDKMPAYLRKTKAALLMNVRICSGLNTEDYAKAIDEYRQMFPNEPNINMLMIDGYFMQKNYAKVIQVVNALDSQINKDPLLDYYRYLSYNMMLDEEKAGQCLKRLNAAMPDFEKGVLELIAVNMEKGNKAVADSLITGYRKKTKFDQEALTRIITYYR